MHVLLQTRLVAPLNIIFHPVGQLAPPTLGGFLLMHRNWCTHPRAPGQRCTPWSRDATYTPKGVRNSAHKNGRESRQVYASCHKGRWIVRYVPTVGLILELLLVVEGLSHQVLDESLLPQVKLGCVGYPHQPPPVPRILSIVLNQNVRERPFGEVRQDDPQKAGFHNIPLCILDKNGHLILPSVGHDALKVKELIHTAW